LRPTILKLKPGTRGVSHSFLMDDRDPDERLSSDHGPASFWGVPAPVEGNWTLRSGGSKDAIGVRLGQTFQQVTGTAGETERSLTKTSLRGDALEFSFDDDGTPVRVVARVNGDKMDAQVTRGGKTRKYVGTRSG